MKPNFVDPEMTHSREHISAQNREIDRLCAAILPDAQSLVEQAVVHHTAQAANEVLLGEAETMLKSLLAELDDNVNSQLIPPTTTTTSTSTVTDDNQEWIAELARDFAFAASAFWMNLGKSEKDRSEQYHMLVLLEQLGPGAYADFDLIASRFYVGQEGRTLLDKLHAIALQDQSILMVTELTLETYAPALSKLYISE